MVDWNFILDQLMMYWEEFASWFLSIPIYGQIAVIFAAVAILIIVGILIYYILKGVAYLIYYMLKGIIIGIYKLIRELYYAISGKEKPVKDHEEEKDLRDDSQQVYLNSELQEINPNAAYCSQCGSEFSEKVLKQLYENGVIFCANCGKGYKANLIVVEN
jgi:DNA-directed RNA polymerase subunit RPC12/RpoP